MTSYPLGFRFAQVVAITGAGWLGGMLSDWNAASFVNYLHNIGNIASLSLIATPALIQSREDKAPSDQVARQWQSLYELGKTQNPPISAVAASTFLYLAWAVRSGSPLFKQTPVSQTALFSTAAALCISIAPWTFIAMVKTNSAIAAKTRSKSESDAELVPLLKRWSTLNMLRGLFPTLAAVVGLVAAFL